MITEEFDITKRVNFGISSAAEVLQNAIRESLSGLCGLINVIGVRSLLGMQVQVNDSYPSTLQSCEPVTQPLTTLMLAYFDEAKYTEIFPCEDRPSS